MADLMIILFYLGGVWNAPDEWGFWKSIGWPYSLGKLLITHIK